MGREGGKCPRGIEFRRSSLKKEGRKKGKKRRNRVVHEDLNNNREKEEIFG